MGIVWLSNFSHLFSVPEKIGYPYTKQDIETFVTIVSPYTANIDEEPSLAAACVGVDGVQFADSEFVEKPGLINTLPSQIKTEAKSERKEFLQYTVVSSDTLSGIARRYDVSAQTIADANQLSSVHKIQVGQKLLIPPADGIVHTVARGETVSSIVKRYQGNLQETLRFTSEKIQPGEKILVVGGRQPQPSVERQPTRLAFRDVAVRDESSGRRLTGGGNRYNGYPWGWCTWYAAYRRNIPSNWGNAGQWLSAARSSGYATGYIPQPGAIIVTSESWFGHVAYVEEVNGDMVTVSEMNYRGWGVVSRRTISRHSSFIKGYIY